MNLVEYQRQHYEYNVSLSLLSPSVSLLSVCIKLLYLLILTLHYSYIAHHQILARGLSLRVCVCRLFTCVYPHLFPCRQSDMRQATNFNCVCYLPVCTTAVLLLYTAVCRSHIIAFHLLVLQNITRTDALDDTTMTQLLLCSCRAYYLIPSTVGV